MSSCQEYSKPSCLSIPFSSFTRAGHKHVSLGYSSAMRQTSQVDPPWILRAEPENGTGSLHNLGLLKCQLIHPWSLTWFTWKSAPGKGDSGFWKPTFFRFHLVNFGGVCLCYWLLHTVTSTFCLPMLTHGRCLLKTCMVSLAGPSVGLPRHTTDPNWSCLRRTVTSI